MIENKTVLLEVKVQGGRLIAYASGDFILYPGIAIDFIAEGSQQEQGIVLVEKPHPEPDSDTPDEFERAGYPIIIHTWKKDEEDVDLSINWQTGYDFVE